MFAFKFQLLAIIAVGLALLSLTKSVAAEDAGTALDVFTKAGCPGLPLVTYHIEGAQACQKIDDTQLSVKATSLHAGCSIAFYSTSDCSGERNIQGAGTCVNTQDSQPVKAYKVFCGLKTARGFRRSPSWARGFMGFE